ncbi:hypothetical protein PV327_010755 [Microctonus hyperodae]|uniref:Ribosomal RNA-processing protein 14/surfeit locus protein 6 C-terminal domain-containing protein n=1 Tax=Microctonus hyperodae TaxID=165561 RepID=A0AA39EY09_MICHY|nr:hypothetical protein PV327_010755 [Microctonus hyperodae]
MQLKMNNKFNFKLTKDILLEENKFISDIFSRMPLPMTELEGINAADSDNEQNEQQQKGKSFANDGRTKRAQTFGELHEKLNELKGQKKLSYKQKQLKKGLKNRIKKKTKREVRLMQKKNIKKDGEEGDDLISSIKKNDELPKVSRAKPVFNSEGNMVFSKFDFSDIGTKKKSTKAEKDPKKILQQLKDKKEELKTLVDSGDKEKAQEIQQKEMWKNVLAKASGIKVKDDPELLKRTIKREEQQKKRSTKKWESRIHTVEKAKQDRQNKRQENIMGRKKDKKNNKLKKAVKKGRIIPGF